ncbi:MAG: hypothetical protein K0Q94_687 [Paenibacillus sp.]|uniref:DUF6807 domain-containing protein n=1 Tax=Paenibacillus sp. GCM10012303 TaxID=3317340 RepID=UPI0029F2E4B9|nr:hypothetical protein [Paenibacillus sp.]
MTVLLKLNVQAGPRDRECCPVSYRLPADPPQLGGISGGRLGMIGPDGAPVALQSEESGGGVTLTWIVDRLEAGRSAVYSIVEAADSEGGPDDEVRLAETETGIEVHIDGRYFTSYVFDPQLAKPYLGPVIGPEGESFTRLDFETSEHPHHRSVWLAVGDVNGIDVWNEPKERHGRQLTSERPERISGPVYARITAPLRWCSYGGKAQLAETRTMTFYRTPAGGRIVDLDCELTALGRVEFGATKEAGPLGIRVAESINADNGGTIVNAFGSVGEKECWGERAPWCDYYGRTASGILGIAAFDHPDNADFPTHWHVRDYGLLAANNLYFMGGKLFSKGLSIRYRHRLYFHEGDTASAKVGDKYQDYIHPPAVELVSS